MSINYNYVPHIYQLELVVAVSHAVMPFLCAVTSIIHIWSRLKSCTTYTLTSTRQDASPFQCTSSTAGDATTGHVLCYCPTPHSAGLALCSFAYSKRPTLSNLTSVVANTIIPRVLKLPPSQLLMGRCHGNNLFIVALSMFYIITTM